MQFVLSLLRWAREHRRLVSGSPAGRRGSGPQMPGRLRPHSAVLAHMMRGVWLFMQPGLVLVALFLISFVVYTYFAYAPALLGFQLLSAKGVLLTGVGLFLLFNVLFNYFMAVCMPPGFVEYLTPQTPPPPGLDERGADVHGNKVYCFPCKRLKVPRSHHCSLCGKCVLRMDHHCPWIANCVGLFNYRYFYLFMFWLLLGVVYLSFLYYKPMMSVFMPWALSREDIVLYRHVSGYVVASSIIAFAASWGVLVLCGFHSILISQNLTSIESFKLMPISIPFLRMRPRTKNPYNLGCMGNLRELFGTNINWFTWILPSFRPLPSVGLHYAPILKEDSETTHTA